MPSYKISVIYIKNDRGNGIKAHFVVTANGVERRKFLLEPELHKRAARRHALAEAMTWVSLIFPGVVLKRVGRGLWGGATPETQSEVDWESLQEEMKEVLA